MSPTPAIDRGPVPDLGRLLGRLLALRREHAGETVTELAARAGVSPPGLIEVEKGRANPTLKRIETLSGLYGARLAVVDLDLLEQMAAWLDSLDRLTAEAVACDGDTDIAAGFRYAINVILSPGPIPIL